MQHITGSTHLIPNIIQHKTSQSRLTHRQLSTTEYVFQTLLNNTMLTHHTLTWIKHSLPTTPQHSTHTNDTLLILDHNSLLLDWPCGGVAAAWVRGGEATQQWDAIAGLPLQRPIGQQAMHELWALLHVYQGSQFLDADSNGEAGEGKVAQGWANNIMFPRLN